MSLIDRIKKASTISNISILSESPLFYKKDLITTSVPAINIAFSGKLDGGFTPGLTTFAGPSKHFKSMFSLICGKAFLDKYPESIILFYDSEFGTPLGYFDTLNIDKDRVVHIPITDIEQLKFDIMTQLNNFEKSDKVIIIIDSIGNLASKKEVEDALDQKAVADMSRAKQIKSLFRMVTPHLTLKDIPMIVVNHTYKTMELYAKDVVGGGTGSYYSSDNIFILGRQQEKTGTDVTGYNFIINVEKSRYVKEKSKIPVTVRFDGGLSKWSGLLDMAIEAGVVVKPSNGWYSKVNPNTGEIEEKKYRIKDTETSEFWNPLLEDDKFRTWIEKHYTVSSGNMLSDSDIDKELEVV
jgi:RecA/RadA recombinase